MLPHTESGGDTAVRIVGKVVVGIAMAARDAEVGRGGRGRSRLPMPSPYTVFLFATMGNRFLINRELYVGIALVQFISVCLVSVHLNFRWQPNRVIRP